MGKLDSVREYLKKSLKSDFVEYSKEYEREIYSKAATRILSRYEHLISYNEIMRRLMAKGNIISINDTNKVKGLNGWFDIKTRHLCVISYIRTFTDTLFHEIIHKVGANKNLEDNNLGLLKCMKNGNSNQFLGCALNEGATEYCIEQIYLQNSSAIISNKLGLLLPHVPEKLYNSYTPLKAIAGQMHQLLKTDSIFDSVLNSNDSFEKEFSDKYGEETYIRIREESDVLLELILQEKEASCIKSKYNDIQNYIMMHCWGIEFNNANTSKQKLETLIRLREFSKYIDQNMNEESYYIKYYNDRYNEISHLFEGNSKENEELQGSSITQQPFCGVKIDNNKLLVIGLRTFYPELIEIQNLKIYKYKFNEKVCFNYNINDGKYIFNIGDRIDIRRNNLADYCIIDNRELFSEVHGTTIISYRDKLVYKCDENITDIKEVERYIVDKNLVGELEEDKKDLDIILNDFQKRINEDKLVSSPTKPSLLDKLKGMFKKQQVLQIPARTEEQNLLNDREQFVDKYKSENEGQANYSKDYSKEKKRNAKGIVLEDNDYR